MGNKLSLHLGKTEEMNFGSNSLDQKIRLYLGFYV